MNVLCEFCFGIIERSTLATINEQHAKWAHPAQTPTLCMLKVFSLSDEGISLLVYFPVLWHQSQRYHVVLCADICDVVLGHTEQANKNGSWLLRNVDTKMC